MRDRFALLLPAVLAAALLSWGCAPAAPAPAPTKASAAPTAAAPPAPAPTSAPAPAPTAAPAKKVDFPEKGKSITLIVPTEPGGYADSGARIMAPALEKVLGVSISVVYKPGASTQVGMTELAKARPDGYTIGQANMPSGILAYLDPDRKASFARKDYAPLATQSWSHSGFGVKADSPFKTVKDLVDGAKAKPGEVSISTIGKLSANHLTVLELQHLANVRFRVVHFTGGAPAVTAVLGGFVNAASAATGNFTAQLNSGDLRLLGIMSKEESKFFPGVKTFEQQGYKIFSGSVLGYAAPAGTPKEIVEILSSAMTRAMDAEHRKKLEDQFIEPFFQNSAQFATYWAELETQLGPLLEEAKKEA